MATILAKESASQEGEEKLTQVADPERMEGAAQPSTQPRGGQRPREKTQRVVCWYML